MLIPDLSSLVRNASLNDLPEIRAALARAETEVLLRLRLDGPQHDPGGTAAPTADRWITPDQAAEIATVPRDRIYAWARGQRWASRPSRKCLRISEPGFRRWLQ